MRKISKELVCETINNPDEMVDGNDTKISQKIIGDKMLRVVFKECEKTYVVITTYLKHKERYKGGEQE